MRRRDFVTSGAALLAAAPASQAPAARHPMPDMGAGVGEVPPGPPADHTLRIAPIALEIAPSHFISTIGYNGTSPGPLLRLKEGRAVTVDVINDSDAAEVVHWHGMFLPPEVDGAEEEGTALIPPGARRRYRFTPRPAGTRWYHSHAMAMGDLHRGTYTGQYGFAMVEGHDPGRYDQEVFLALRDWEPFYTDQFVDMDEQQQPGPQPERPAKLNTRHPGLEAVSQVYTINDRMLNAGDPIRVRPGTRVLMHLLNASAIEIRSVALPAHEFHVLALDGNPVPHPAAVKVLTLGPGERIDAYVEMRQPGVWILGELDDATRNAGLGVVIQYQGQHRPPQWLPPPPRTFWDYSLFGTQGAHAAPDRTLEMIFERLPGGSGQFDTWSVNGKPYPHQHEFVLERGKRHRLVFRNRSDDSHPLHLHRHLFELVDVNGRLTKGVLKDTVIVPMYGRVSVDLTADQPGLSLFHCHIQQHMDFGFKALFRYA
ncbi:MAG TPA: multicopper oxidase domain-containing protein [Steroidobacteraceae bacterium]|nr:multicopper oxidase domain-containing protein [Steroidobacteraceae bacterium]